MRFHIFYVQSTSVQNCEDDHVRTSETVSSSKVTAKIAGLTNSSGKRLYKLVAVNLFPCWFARKQFKVKWIYVICILCFHTSSKWANTNSTTEINNDTQPHSRDRCSSNGSSSSSSSSSRTVGSDGGYSRSRDRALQIYTLLGQLDAKTENDAAVVGSNDRRDD
jgi:hypothetical protein